MGIDSFHWSLHMFCWHVKPSSLNTPLPWALTPWGAAIITLACCEAPAGSSLMTINIQYCVWKDRQMKCFSRLHSEYADVWYKQRMCRWSSQKRHDCLLILSSKKPLFCWPQNCCFSQKKIVFSTYFSEMYFWLVQPMLKKVETKVFSDQRKSSFFQFL